ncbi:MAG TPA: acetyl-CoA acetyltransferase [Caulobacteraceae bacterium]
MARDLRPVIIGVGEASERIDAADYQALSPVALASQAAQAALEDAGAAQPLSPHIDVIAAIRQFEVSGPNAKPPFGAADNFPRAVAARIGADPARAILEPVGGQGPQHLVNEFAQAIGRGEMQMALLVGSEAISTVRHLTSKGETRDWSQSIGGQLEDRGYGMEGLLTADLARHGARTPISVYALCENARRGRLALGREAYALQMGKLFSPFTRVAAGNPHAMSHDIYKAEELATVTGPNRLTSDPFPRRMVARDQANQGAAVLITSATRARELGVPEDRLVYLHGGADVKERTVIERHDLSSSPAAVMAAKQALGLAGLAVEDIDLFDLYSCFPIAVFNVRDGLHLSANDLRPLTVTGGLPFFGGAGNNYSMHAIASMVRALRSHPGDNGLVGANGGFLSKYSVGVYSTRPSNWTGFDSGALQAEIDGWTAPRLAEVPALGVTARGIVDTYTIDYSAQPPRGIVVGRRVDGDARFVAMSDNPTIVQSMIEREPLWAQVSMAADDNGRCVLKSFTPAA